MVEGMQLSPARAKVEGITLWCLIRDNQGPAPPIDNDYTAGVSVSELARRTQVSRYSEQW